MSRPLFQITSRPVRQTSIDHHDSDVDQKIKLVEEYLSQLRASKTLPRSDNIQLEVLDKTEDLTERVQLLSQYQEETANIIIDQNREQHEVLLERNIALEARLQLQTQGLKIQEERNSTAEEVTSFCFGVLVFMQLCVVVIVSVQLYMFMRK